MKTNDKWFGVIFLLIIIIFFIVFIPQQKISNGLHYDVVDSIVNKKKEGFVKFFKKAVKTVKKAVKTVNKAVVAPVVTAVKKILCDKKCKARKAAAAAAAAERERKRLAAIAAAAALRKRKRDCKNTGGKWRNYNNKCYKRTVPPQIYKRRPSPPPPPPVPAFCDKDPTFITEQCKKINKKGSCNSKGCCKWCNSKAKCVPYVTNTIHANTLDYLEC